MSEEKGSEETEVKEEPKEETTPVKAPESEYDEGDPEEFEKKISPDEGEKKAAEGEEEEDKSTETPGDEEQEEEDATEEKKDPIPDALLQRALNAGFSREEASGFSDANILERVVGRIETAVTAPPVDPKALESGKTGETQEVEEFEFDFPEGEYDESFQKIMQPAADLINSQAKALRDLNVKMDTLTQDNQNRQTQEFQARLDGLFENLGETYHETFGQGSTQSLGANSALEENRGKILLEMNAIATGYASTGQKIPSEKDLLQRAVQVWFPEVGKQAANKKIQKKLRNQQGQFSSPPNGRKVPTKNMSPRDIAAAAVAAKMRDQGMEPVSDEDPEEFGAP